MFKIKKTKFKDLLVVSGMFLGDTRGYLREILIEKIIKKKFKFHLVSKSKKNVLRGLHYQLNKMQGKYISVIKGKIFDVAVDLRPESDSYKKWIGYFLSEQDNKFIYIPEGFAHGYSVESNNALVHYKCTKHYNLDNEIGIIWNDSNIKIKWPANNPQLSDKDNSL